MTMGEFLADPKCALVQTPHHFFSPDPFERNFDTFRRVPNEGSLFYGLIQDGNDFWNATFFCGSCAVIKRAPLLEIGGIAVETVTEDAHTALKLHRLGYNSAYLRTVQAAGLATESLSGHIGQRIRWARGMAQIFRIDNPLLGRGLHLFQRICYSNAMLHFFYGIPRLIFLTMPIAYLYFGLHVINTSALLIMAYVLPYLFVANVTNSRLQGRYRHSFWAEVYESVLAWYIVLPTTVAFINPRLGKFNVTAKGGQIADDYLDWTISKPYLVLLALNVVGLAVGVGHLLFGSTDEPATVLMNMGWALANLIMLGAAVGVARRRGRCGSPTAFRCACRPRCCCRTAPRWPAAPRTTRWAASACCCPWRCVLDDRRARGGLPGARHAHLSLPRRGHAQRQPPPRRADGGPDRRARDRTDPVHLRPRPTPGSTGWTTNTPTPSLRSLKEVIEMGYQGLLRLYDACAEVVDLLIGRHRPRQP